MDVDDVIETRPPKKAKKNVTNAKTNKSESSDGEEHLIQNMDRYMDKSSWEGLVKKVDTVERVGDSLMVFFTLYVPWYFLKSMFLNNFEGILVKQSGSLQQYARNVFLKK